MSETSIFKAEARLMGRQPGVSFSIEPFVDPLAACWSYVGEKGPEYWQAVLGESCCAGGVWQSPVEIDQTVLACFEPLVFCYDATRCLSVYDSGHHLAFTCPPDNVLYFQGNAYTLFNGHFHCPSEEVINGQRSDAVLHLVHKNERGELLVVAVLLSVSDRAPEYPLFSFLVNYFVYGHMCSLCHIEVEMSTVLPSCRQAFYTYIGSLTVPPCTEGVRWIILQETLPISRQTLQEIGKIYTDNVRPLQCLHGRIVYSSRCSV